MISLKNLTITIILFSMLATGYHYYKNPPANEWLEYKNKKFGIEFEYPAGLTPFEADVIVFRDCADCPGLINIEKQSVNSLDIRKAMKEIGYKDSNIIGETQIDGLTAIVTTPFDSENKNPTDKAVLFIKNNDLYRVYYRAQQIERFWRSIRIY